MVFNFPFNFVVSKVWKKIQSFSNYFQIKNSKFENNLSLQCEKIPQKRKGKHWLETFLKT
jgi:hypothetical protein